MKKAIRKVLAAILGIVLAVILAIFFATGSKKVLFSALKIVTAFWYIWVIILLAIIACELHKLNKKK